ncbi:hypothetical protein MYU51_017275 [Penicillium brevicompactum]
MPDDLLDNESIFDLNELFTSAPKRILEVGFSYMSGDLTDEARTGLTRDQWDALKGQIHNDLQASTLRDDLLCEMFESELFPAFQSKSPNTDSDEESTGSSHNLIERSAQDTSDVEDEQYSRYGDESSGGYNLV